MGFGDHIKTAGLVKKVKLLNCKLQNILKDIAAAIILTH